MIYGIVAGARRPDGAYVIGKDNVMPWHLPDELKLFKRKTLGKTIVMGRKTFENLPQKPLPGRKNIVLTTQKDWKYPGVEVAHDIQSLIDKHATSEHDHLYVTGGSEIYKQFLPVTHQLHFTHIEHHIPGDTLFPLTHAEINEHFTPVESENHVSAVNPDKWNGNDQVRWNHVIYERKGPFMIAKKSLLVFKTNKYVYFSSMKNRTGESDAFFMRSE